MEEYKYIIFNTYVIENPTRMMIELYNFLHDTKQQEPPKRNTGVKIKIFKPNGRYKSTIRQRFQRLHRRGYTHVINMRGGHLSKIKK